MPREQVSDFVTRFRRVKRGSDGTPDAESFLGLEGMIRNFFRARKIGAGALEGRGERAPPWE